MNTRLSFLICVALTTTARATPLLICPPDRTVECGQAWSFESPAWTNQCVFDTLVYDNSINDLTHRFNPGTVEVGDEIVLEGNARQLTRLVIEYWGTNAVDLAFQGDVQARLRLYANDGPGFAGYPTPGTVLYDSGPFPVSATPRATLIFEDFTADAAVALTQALPDSFTWSVQFSGLAPNDAAGVDLFSPPVIGQAFPDYWERTAGGWVLKTNTAVALDFAARIEATGANAGLRVLSTVTNALCGRTFTATRTWEAIDDCDQTNTCSQTVTVIDTTPPVLDCAPDKTVVGGQPWTFDPPVASDQCVFDTLVYDNSVNDLLFRFNPGEVELGDEIVLAGTARRLSRFVFEYWGTNAVGPRFQGDVRARLRFYANDGPDFAGYPTPGTVLYDSGLFPVAATPRATLIFEDFTLDAAVPLTRALPDSFTWTVQFSGFSPNDAAGVDLYSPPVVGQAFPDYWERTAGGWVLKTNAAVAMDFAARAEAAHSPITVAVLSTVTNRMANSYAVRRTWQATDPCGNAATCVQSVTVLLTLPEAVDAPELTFKQGGDTSWFGQTVVTHDGVDAAQSGAIADNQNTRLETFLEGPGTIGFWWKVSSEPADDQLRFYIGGEEQERISGEVDWQYRSFAVPAGRQLVKWRYSKDGSRTAGADAAWVDAVRFTPSGQPIPPVIIEPPAGQTGHQGGRVSFSVAVVGSRPLNFQWRFNGTDLSDGPHVNGANTDTLTLQNLEFTQAGSYSVLVSNAAGGVSSAEARLEVLPPLTLPEAVDALYLTLSQGGNAAWIPQTVVTHDGVDAAQSGVIDDDENTRLETWVTGPGVVSFWWKVSSQREKDQLRFYINPPGRTREMARISGEVDWQFRSFEVPAGDSILLKWRYSKNGSTTRGQDAGWVDQVSYVPFVPMIIRPPVSQTVARGDTVTFLVEAIGTPPLTYQWRLNGVDLVDGGIVNGAQSPILTLTGVGAVDAGNYSVMVANSSGSITSAPATLTVTMPITRVVRVGCSSSHALRVPVWLIADGNENAVGFSLRYDPAVLRDPVVTAGRDLGGASLIANTAQTSAGKLGIAVALPSGRMFAAGTNELVSVEFTLATPVPAPTSVAIQFGNEPIGLETSDAQASPLPTRYEEGCITINLNYYEADVAPRPLGNNDGRVMISDWVQVGRFMAALDPVALGLEFQRADCAPRATRGDGKLTIADWVQAGRYAGSLDPVVPVGGPDAPLPSSSSAPGFSRVAPWTNPGRDRLLRIVNVSAQVGRLVRVPVILDAAGNENGLAFTLAFDPAVLELAGVALAEGLGEARLLVNSSGLTPGRAGAALALPPGAVMPPGKQGILYFSFRVLAADTTTTVSFTDDLVAREVASARAEPVATEYASGTVTIRSLPGAGALRLFIVPSSPEGTVRLQVGRWDNSPMEPSAMDAIAILASPTLTEPLSAWTRLDAAMTWSNGRLQVDGLEALPGSNRFYRAVELK